MRLPKSFWDQEEPPKKKEKGRSDGMMAEDIWMDSNTKLKKHRKKRERSNAVAKASRRAAW